MADKLLDCRGMSCPMPIVQLSLASREMQAGDTIEVYANDLAFKLDLEAWSRRLGHSIQSFEDGDEQHAYVRLSTPGGNSQ